MPSGSAYLSQSAPYGIGFGIFLINAASKRQKDVPLWGPSRPAARLGWGHAAARRRWWIRSSCCAGACWRVAPATAIFHQLDTHAQTRETEYKVSVCRFWCERPERRSAGAHTPSKIKYTTPAERNEIIKAFISGMRCLHTRTHTRNTPRVGLPRLSIHPLTASCLISGHLFSVMFQFSCHSTCTHAKRKHRILLLIPNSEWLLRASGISTYVEPAQLNLLLNYYWAPSALRNLCLEVIRFASF